MSVYSDVYGQKKLIEHFKKTVKDDKIANAYIISGEKLSGKKMLVKKWATSIECENPVDGEACMECHACKMSLSDNNPDIKFVIPSKEGKNISVDDIRGQVNNDMGIKPYYCKKKIYIIDEAENLNSASQNAILKTLEEPPGYGMIILLTSNENALLPTILSRCVQLHILPTRDSDIKEYLMEREHLPDYAADVVVAAACGNLGRAVDLSKSGQFYELKDMVSDIYSNYKRDMKEIGDMAKKICEHKDSYEEFFSLLNMWNRDILILKSGAKADRLIFRDEEKTLLECSRRYSYKGIERVIKQINETKAELFLNVNAEMAFRVMLMTIRDSAR